MPRSKLRQWWSKASSEVDTLTLDRIWIGSISRCARGYLTISQNELAAASGVGRTTILSVEKGTTVPDNETAARLRKYFETAGVVADMDGESLNVKYSVPLTAGPSDNADLVKRSFTRWKIAKTTRSRALRGGLDP